MRKFTPTPLQKQKPANETAGNAPAESKTIAFLLLKRNDQDVRGRFPVFRLSLAVGAGNEAVRDLHIRVKEQVSLWNSREVCLNELGSTFLVGTEVPVDIREHYLLLVFLVFPDDHPWKRDRRVVITLVETRGMRRLAGGEINVDLGKRRDVQPFRRTIRDPDNDG